MNSAKAYLGVMVRIFREKGLETVVFSPGSRNAPLIQAFYAVTGLRILSVADERSAAFFALGVALRTGRPTAIACTSGSAVLNYAPAIAEAYYQHLPLLVLTADRPAEWIDQGDGQTIRQENIYANYIKKYFRYPQHIRGDDDVQYIMRLASEAYEESLLPEPGPVHINFPFTEPLYDLSPDLTTPVRIIRTAETTPAPSGPEMEKLAHIWHKSSKKMILTGQIPAGHGLKGLLETLTGDPSVVLLTETTSNVHVERSIPGIDKVISTVTEKEAELFAPDLLITTGGHIVSKMIKKFLRDHPPREHWHVSPSGTRLDTFRSLTRTIQGNPETFLRALAETAKAKQGKSEYALRWYERDRRSESRHTAFLESVPFSDLKAFDILFRELPAGSTLHLANSTPVRYSQLFRMPKLFHFHCNRGVSGIDGCLSTAAGAALDAEEDTFLLTGDIAFFYDRNGLWHEHVSKKLKIIIINNGGGGIFRFIDGPETTGRLDLFETPHRLTARHVAALYDIPYLVANDEETLPEKIRTISTMEGPVILEVFTPREENGRILREYFKRLAKKE